MGKEHHKSPLVVYIYVVLSNFCFLASTFGSACPSFSPCCSVASSPISSFCSGSVWLVCSSCLRSSFICCCLSFFRLRFSASLLVDRNSFVWGKGVSVRVDFGVCVLIKKKK